MSKSNIIKRLSIPFATLIGLIIISLLLMVLATSIPRSAIRSNIASTVAHIHEEGGYPIVRIPVLLMDNFTDCLMCNIVLSADSCSLAEKVLLNPTHIDSTNKQIEQTYLWTQGKYYPNKRHYGRYWHGYQVPLSLLLLVTDYKGIRVFNGILYYLLLGCSLWLMKLRLGWRPAVAFFFAISVVAAPVVVPLSLQFYGCHVIMLAATITVLLRKRQAKDCLHIDFTIFLTIGAITAFIDLFTTPIITLGMPLACYIAYHNPKNTTKTFLLFSLAWLIGYAGMWVSKWILATAITGEDVIANAIDKANLRTVGHNFYLDTLNSIKPLINNAMSWFTANTAGIIILSLIIISITGVGVLLLRSRKSLKQQAWLLAIGALPIIWFCIILQHSISHFFFTWRAILVTIFAIVTMVLFSFKLKNHGT